MSTDKCHDQVVGAVWQLHTKHPGVGRERWMGRRPAPGSLCDSAHDKVTGGTGTRVFRLCFLLSFGFGISILRERTLTAERSLGTWAL